ncbi:MAG TPA: EF-hand domain-containing protein, partial [Beijerinckiaceae bacterium]|nr:EF-hand domain-containing protein [Beijerinckiaceae bacterium]
VGASEEVDEQVDTEDEADSAGGSDSLMSEIDANGDGMISLDELMNALLGRNQSGASQSGGCGGSADGGGQGDSGCGASDAGCDA